jgi:hypothetical protein
MSSPLSEKLRNLIPPDGKSVTIQELLDQAGENGILLMMILLNIPFTLPIPIPNLSTPFGIALLLLGAKLAWGIPKRLPDFIAQKSIPPSTLRSILEKCIRVAEKTEKWIKPRSETLCSTPFFKVLNLTLLMIMAFILTLPLGFPLTNLFPAITMIIIALGIMEKDGHLILLGYLTGLLSFVYLFLLYHFGKSIIIWIREMVS